VGLERGGAVVAAAHLESGLLLGNPVRPEAASVHSSGWRFHFDHSRACHRMEERDRPKFVEPHLFGRVAAPRFRVPDPSRGGL
jgi:hypothetical protein